MGTSALRTPRQMEFLAREILQCPRKMYGAFCMFCKCMQVFGVHRRTRICLSVILAWHF